jgi:hypothetical protein
MARAKTRSQRVRARMENFTEGYKIPKSMKRHSKFQDFFKPWFYKDIHSPQVKPNI